MTSSKCFVSGQAIDFIYISSLTVQELITPFCTLSSCFILTSPNVSHVTDRATGSSQFCVQFTDEMHVDCNHFGHQMFLSLWSEHLIKYCSILERRMEDRGWGWGRSVGKSSVKLVSRWKNNATYGWYLK